MAGWKVLFICVFACVCLALALSTILVPMAHQDGQWWLWLGGLLTATLCVGALFTLFLRHAGRSLDSKPRAGRN
jgi:hypothetical protein